MHASGGGLADVQCCECDTEGIRLMKRVERCGLWMVAGLVFAALTASGAGTATCGDLAKVSLPSVTITMAKVVAAGEFQPPGDQKGKGGNEFRDLPAFCRVTATLAPTPDSDIKVEVWLPIEG